LVTHILKIKAMKNYLTDCKLCQGNGKIEVSGNDEPYYEDWVTCDYCEEGKVIDTDEVEFKVAQIEDMVEGFTIRVSIFQDMANKCKLGYLDNLARKFEKRIETCEKAILRLNNYKLTIQNL